MDDMWQVLKDGAPIGVYATIEEAENAYVEHDADEIRRITGGK